MNSHHYFLPNTQLVLFNSYVVNTIVCVCVYNIKTEILWKSVGKIHESFSLTDQNKTNLHENEDPSIHSDYNKKRQFSPIESFRI